MVRFKARDGRNPKDLAVLDMDSHLKDERLKQKYVSTMFDILAPGYDTFTRVFSFGMDKGWKSTLIREGVARAPKSPRILDLACGTGDLCAELAERTQSPLAIGCDLSPQMLIEASRRARQTPELKLQFAVGNMLTLALPDASVDLVSIGYGIRNTHEPDRALREIARVLRPGGVLLNLDFYRPTNALWRELYLGYMLVAGNFAGWLWHREPITYGYLAPSIRRFVTMPEFESGLDRAGFALEWRKSHLFGALGLHVARKR
ncbi:MAG: ubiquinone/menaquinone biosynthesis methyltransferase [Acidobacteriota bacterium]